MFAGNGIEREVQFAGVLPEIALTLDPSSRTEVLRMVDLGKREQRLTQIHGPQTTAALHIDMYSMKLFSKDKRQEPLLRIPIHQVAAVSYIKEDDQHILAIKFGEVTKTQSADETTTCSLAIAYCDSRLIAEEICSYVDLCFQSIYTDATMNFFDRSLIEGTQASARKDNTYSNLSNNDMLMTNFSHLSKENGSLGFLSHSSLSLGNTGTASSASALSHLTRQNSETEISPAANELILDYMNKLYTKLSASELQEFALLVKAWHTNMTFPDFCQRVLDLYGSDRRHLLVGMRPFIPAKDSMYFERFLQLSGFVEDDSDANAQSWTIGPQRHHRGSCGSLTDSFEMIDRPMIDEELGSNTSIEMS